MYSMYILYNILGKTVHAICTVDKVDTVVPKWILDYCNTVRQSTP